ncbi:pyridoxal phosphate-dependent aminotransferase [Patescibacteria group bacterium]
MLSRRIFQIPESATLSISARAKVMKAAGEDVLNFSAGEPDVVTPEHIGAAAKQAIDENFSYYTPSGGIPELREAVVAKFARENNITTSDERVIVANGAKEALFLLCQTILNEGDEVILPTPHWVSHYEQIKYAGGVPVLLKTDKNFHFTAEDIERVGTEKTKAVLLNSPSNPTGAMIHPDELRKIAELAIENDLIVISDEPYEHFIYDGNEHLSIGSLEGMDERAVTVNGLSKTYSMSGWRVGFATGPQEIIEGMIRLKSHLSSGTIGIAQKAAVAALNGQQDLVAEMQQLFAKRRDLAWDGLNAVEGCSAPLPEGAFYVFADFAELIERKGFEGSVELCEKLLDEVGVALVPGEAFGDDFKTYTRFSFAATLEDIEEGVERIAQFAQE